MNHTSLNTFLTSNIDVDETLLAQLLSKYKIANVKKGEYLLQLGKICKHTFFVEQGLLRQYSIDSKGKEHTIQFAPEKWFISNRESMYFNQPSQYVIQALEDSTVVLLDEHFTHDLSTINKDFVDFNNRLLHNHIRNLQHRINQLLSATAEERYLDFIKVYPDILLRVPQIMVASYLGITPESLSRIRKELAVKNFRNN